MSLSGYLIDNDNAATVQYDVRLSNVEMNPSRNLRLAMSSTETTAAEIKHCGCRCSPKIGEGEDGG